MRKKVFISSTSFGAVSSEPLDLLQKSGLEIARNQLGRRITPDELAEHITGTDYLIAGMEPITAKILDAAPNLKLISRIGVGLDNIPFEEIKRRGIRIAYTPNAPTQAVVELVIGKMLCLARTIHDANTNMHSGKWNKHMGNLISGKTVGIIGVGRIGKTLVKCLAPFDVNLLGNDIKVDKEFFKKHNVHSVSKAELFAKSDFISLNLSSTPAAKHLINEQTLGLMKPSAYLINTARGVLINETDLHNALVSGRIRGAALDVFEQEPYKGVLTALPNVLLTCHMGAATQESRLAMELGAVEEVLLFNSTNTIKHEAFNQYS